MIQEALPDLSLQSESRDQTRPSDNRGGDSQRDTNVMSQLIEFPGATRAMPEWRKQLSQRVREVQERKAREAAEELAAAQEAGLVSCALPSGQLELVPDLEQPVMNPIVSKALERLDRARRFEATGDSHGRAVAAAPALALDFEHLPSGEQLAEKITSPKTKLKVVSSPSTVEVNEAPAMVETSIVSAPEPDATLKTHIDRKPVRLISEDDPALSYLDTCLSVPALTSDTRGDLPGLSRRFLGGVLDLILIALMISPAIAAVYYTGGNWKDPSVLELLGGITVATIFAYMTLSVALTGRTLAMRMLSLKTIDLRTGLIPTGGQAIKRALGFVFSLALLGLGQAYALIDRDKRTVYDRLSDTIVVRT
ncbi:MAG TPA: RDD family protein [Pyrinomonadaceae bacterium]|jgi:uncharacterized RDD family membrane protein YckC|nr:RDD family protein [Pyrinomonadaceae bacterium]